MEIKIDIPLKGIEWNKAIQNLSEIFTPRTNYDVFMLSLAIGIVYDKRISCLECDSDIFKSVPRNVINNNDNGKLDYFFQSAILFTLTEELSEEERLELAFGENTDFNKISFLLEFANFGVTKLVELLGDTTLETMDSIKNFLFSISEGRNIEIDGIPIEEE